MARNEGIPLVSVIMPYFDHELYLVDAVNSVAALRYPSVELIVVDDCSVGLSAECLLKDHPFGHLKIVKHEQNRGHVAAKNTGVKHSNGQFIVPLDSDDLLEPDFLIHALAAAKPKDVGIVLTEVCVFGDQNYIYTPASTKLDFTKLRTPSNTFLAKREVFQTVGYYDESLKYGDESDFLLSALETGWEIASVPLPLYKYRIHDRGLSTTVSYVTILRNMLKKHRQTFLEYMEETLLYREERYWNEIESLQSAGPDTIIGDNVEVAKRQYQHLHCEFHKLLREYESLTKHFEQTRKERDALAASRYYKLRHKVNKALKSLTRNSK
ncbi:MAG: glycosyltransferase family 2 protein [Candidatus Obscuribacterales bacterium]|nr:glycosyltransferase family 2 protein [Candidatus Obscuribacterales bacterium]